MTQDSQTTAATTSGSEPADTGPAAKAAKPAKPVKRPRHLMDPDNLQRPVNDFRLTNVQRWIWTVTIVLTVWHLAFGVLAAAWVLNDDATGGKIGLNVIATLFCMLGFAAGFAMHKKNALAWPNWPWLLICLIPGAISTWLIL